MTDLQQVRVLRAGWLGPHQQTKAHNRNNGSHFHLPARGSSRFVPTLELPRSSADPKLIWTSIGCTCDAVSLSMPCGSLDALSGTLAAHRLACGSLETFVGAVRLPF